MAGIYAPLDWFNMPGRITRLPRWSKEPERNAGRARLDLFEGRDSRWTGPSRTMSQDVLLVG